ncbi:DNA polymerase IV [Persicirhabdus sediminis]|nr:DNA polymerase IV [Persicirhabdus sediminis]
MSATRKIIHIDMDCFYAAIEERENPQLVGKPVGVGGGSRRGVLCTANYEARKFGCHSAMPIFKAMQKCPQLVLLPVRFSLYRSVSAQIKSIFARFTELIEPLSLDEAYLDLSHWESDGSAIAREIRAQIFEETSLHASAGIGPNKLVAKIASDLNKPNGQYEVTTDQLDEFMRQLPVGKIWGVGRKMQQRLDQQNIKTCADLQKFSRIQLAQQFGRWGNELYDLCRGIDQRKVSPHRVRKSLGKETTFSENRRHFNELELELKKLADEVEASWKNKLAEREVKSLVVKLKFEDFTQTTSERVSRSVDYQLAKELLGEALSRGNGKSVRLIGLSVKFADQTPQAQLEMDF